MPVDAGAVEAAKHRVQQERSFEPVDREHGERRRPRRRGRRPPRSPGPGPRRRPRRSGPSSSRRRTVAAAVARHVGERMERGLPPGRSTVERPDRRDHVDELGQAGDPDAVGVTQQRDQQAADRRGRRRRRARPRRSPARGGMGRPGHRGTGARPGATHSTRPRSGRSACGCPSAAQRRRRSPRPTRSSARGRAEQAR